MKYYIVLHLIMFCWSYNNTANAQTILDPADSLSEEKNWFKKYRFSLYSRSSPAALPIVPILFTTTTFNLANRNFYRFLENQGVGPEKSFEGFSIGAGFRMNRTFLEVNYFITDEQVEETDVTNGPDNIIWQHRMRNIDFSIGQILYDGPMFSILLGAGLGEARFNFQYYLADKDNIFDFEDPSDRTVTAYPRFQLDSWTWNVYIELLSGLKKYKKINLLEGFKVGYRQSFKSDDWEVIGTRSVNPINDRIGQIYLSFSVNIGYNFQKK